MCDWLILLNGTRRLWVGANPYVEGFFSPPYVALFLAPFAWMPHAVSVIVYYVLAFAATAYICYKLRFSYLQVVAFAASPPMIVAFANGNLEPFVLLGAVLPMWAGLPLLAMKPQVGGAFIAYAVWRRLAGRGKSTDFVPLIVFLLASFFFCPDWPVEAMAATGTSWNWGFWPHSLAVGLPLLVYGIRKRDGHAALAASPFLSPYMTSQNLAALLLVAVREAPAGLLLYTTVWLGHLVWRGLLSG